VTWGEGEHQELGDGGGENKVEKKVEPPSKKRGKDKGGNETTEPFASAFQRWVERVSKKPTWKKGREKETSACGLERGPQSTTHHQRVKKKGNQETDTDNSQKEKKKTIAQACARLTKKGP